MKTEFIKSLGKYCSGTIQQIFRKNISLVCVYLGQTNPSIFYVIHVFFNLNLANPNSIHKDINRKRIYFIQNLHLDET